MIVIKKMEEKLREEEKELFRLTTIDLGLDPLPKDKENILLQFVTLIEMKKDDFLCKELDADSESTFVLDPPFLLRFLASREFDLNKAVEFLKAHLKWRDEIFPSLLLSDNVFPLLLHSSILRPFGKTKDNKPLILFSLPYLDRMKKTSKNLDLPTTEYVKYVVYFIETTLAENKTGKCVWIFDLNGWGVTTHGTSIAEGSVNDIIRQVLILCQNQYPERLSQALILNSPWLFSTAWSVISGWLDKQTQGKVKFLNKNKDLLKHIDKEELHVSYGGTHPGHQLNLR
eukprot:maker-scaffold_75-snap-gene-0.62-mRNA-1 protein AED:0.00 eAED:0.00 QI:38/1/1/1/1/1/2/117/285